MSGTGTRSMSGTTRSSLAFRHRFPNHNAGLGSIARAGASRLPHNEPASLRVSLLENLQNPVCATVAAGYDGVTMHVCDTGRTVIAARSTVSVCDAHLTGRAGFFIDLVHSVANSASSVGRFSADRLSDQLDRRVEHIWGVSVAIAQLVRRGT